MLMFFKKACSKVEVMASFVTTCTVAGSFIPGLGNLAGAAIGFGLGAASLATASVGKRVYNKLEQKYGVTEKLKNLNSLTRRLGKFIEAKYQKAKQSPETEMKTVKRGALAGASAGWAAGFIFSPGVAVVAALGGALAGGLTGAVVRIAHSHSQKQAKSPVQAEPAQPQDEVTIKSNITPAPVNAKQQQAESAKEAISQWKAGRRPASVSMLPSCKPVPIYREQKDVSFSIPLRCA